jgi:hypothetical protein
MEDFKLGWNMFTKGKLKFFPSGIRGKRELKGFFRGLRG